MVHFTVFAYQKVKTPLLVFTKKAKNGMWSFARTPTKGLDDMAETRALGKNYRP